MVIIFVMIVDYIMIVLLIQDKNGDFMAMMIVKVLTLHDVMFLQVNYYQIQVLVV